MNLWPFKKEQTISPALDSNIKAMSHLSNYGNPDLIFRSGYEAVRIVQQELVPKNEKKTKKDQKTTKEKRMPARWDSDIFKYRPASSKIWQYFPNPMGVFSYFAEYHWAVRAALDVIRYEMGNDGYDLWYAPSATKERIQFVRQFVEEYRLGQLAIEIAIQLKVFGNCYFVTVVNDLGGILAIELLYPDKLWPLYGSDGLTIIGYEYVLRNGKSLIMPASSVSHIMVPSVFDKTMGSPPLSPMVTMIECDMYADVLNNTVQQRGGVLAAILSLKIPSSDGSSPSGFAEDDEDYVEMVQSRIDSLFTGARAGQTLAAIPNIDNVFKISDIGSLENNYSKSKELTGRLVFGQLGVPSERIGLTRDQQYVAIRAEDTISSNFDHMLRDLSARAYGAINTEIFEKILGITDVKLQAVGRYRSTTVAASLILKNVASSGLGATRNELRVNVMGWTPLPSDNPRGWEVVDISQVNRDPEASPVVQTDPPRNVEEYTEEDLLGEHGKPDEDLAERQRQEESLLRTLIDGDDLAGEGSAGLNQWW